MSTFRENKARLDLEERLDLLREVRRQQNILDGRGDQISATGKAILQNSIQQKLDRVQALRTGRPVTKAATLERSRAF